LEVIAFFGFQENRLSNRQNESRMRPGKHQRLSKLRVALSDFKYNISSQSYRKRLYWPLEEE